MDNLIILIDTNIWYIGRCEPSEEEYKQIHQKARDFILEKLEDDTIRIAISSYQIGEILEMLRKGGISKDVRSRLLEDFKPPKFVVENLTYDDVCESLKKSIISNIHIYDYFVAYPLRKIVNKIYSADDHFRHKDFTSICKVENPLSPWILREGKKPQKQVDAINPIF